MAAISMRLATQEDIPAVYTLFQDAIDRMNQTGIPQWDEVYPAHANLDADLAAGQLYVAETDGGAVAAAVALSEECHPDYQTAAWQSGEPSLIVHRLCVSPDFQGQGIARAVMLWVEEWAKARGYACIRLDAFSQNPYALRMYDRLGYGKRGEAVWRKGLFYLLEKPLH
jgi:GNAT superfamily N-acetyltransferase